MIDAYPQPFWRNRVLNWSKFFEKNNREDVLKDLINHAKTTMLHNTTNVDFGCASANFAYCVGIRNYIGIDICKNFLETAKTRIDTTLNEDFWNVTFDNNSVDNVVSTTVIDDYKDNQKKRFFKKIYDMLKPGGYFYFSAYSPDDGRAGNARIDYLQKHQPEGFEIELRGLSELYVENEFYYEQLFRQTKFKIEFFKKDRRKGKLASIYKPVEVHRVTLLYILKK